MPAYRTDTPPVIDGVISPGEWDAAGPPVVVIPEGDALQEVIDGSAFPEDPYGGPDDLSFQYRLMWSAPWTAYLLFEVTDDIAMEEAPGNAWEMDQIELFFDGTDLEGSSDLPSYEWWNNSGETYGKFGASRESGLFEGNGGAMVAGDIEQLYPDGGALAVTEVTETGNNGDYVVEYAVSFERMFVDGVFQGTPAGDAGQIVPDATKVKWRVCISDDDNFGDGTVGRSHTVCTHPVPDWRDSSAFADMVFVGPFGEVGTPGDFNGDGAIDQADFAILAQNFNSEGGSQQGDVDYSGTVDLRDFVQFRDLYGTEAEAVAAAAVPEPQGLAWILLALFAWRRRKTSPCHLQAA
jgi:hypothetical protein